MDRPIAAKPAFQAPQLPLRYQPTPAQVDALIASAKDHPLGLGFLLNGNLDAVAVTFRAHAFTVDAARRRLDRFDS